MNYIKLKLRSLIIYLFQDILFLLIKLLKIKQINNKISFISWPDYSDNSWYLFKHISQNKSNLELVWLFLNDISDNQKNKIKKKYKNNKISFVKKWSISGIYNFLSSKYVFFTHGTYFFIKGDVGPILVNLWHGMPIKKIGYYENKIPFGVYANYALSSSKLYSKVLAKALKFKNVLHLGMPRNDILLKKKKIKFKFKKKKIDNFVI